MALTRSITSLITDGRGYATKEFLVMTPEKWADEHMAERYGQVHFQKDSTDHIATLCWNYLCEEYRSLRSWFTEEGKLSPLLQSKFVTTRLSGPVGNGIGWDFKANGDIETRMLQFKGTLIAAIRAGEVMPKDTMNSGNMQFGGLVKIIRSAYTARAEIHSWRSLTQVKGDKEDKAQTEETVKYSGADLSRRWVSFRTYTMLIQIGADPVWSWEASRCKALFGPIDEDRGAH